MKHKMNLKRKPAAVAAPNVAVPQESVLAPAEQVETKPAGRKLVSSRRLAADAWLGYRRHIKLYSLIIAAVIIPASLIGLSPSLATSASATASFQVYQTFGMIFMEAALIYAIGLIARGQDKPTVRQAYYDGSAAVVRFILAGLWLLVILLPASFAAAIWVTATAPYPGGAAPVLPLIILIGLIVILLVGFALSGWHLVRYGLSIFAVIEDGYTPVKALKYARRLTIGRFWRTLGRQLFLLLILALVFVLSSLPVLLLGLIFHNITILDTIYSAILFLAITPFFNLYLHGLYIDLKKLHGGQ